MKPYRPSSKIPASGFIWLLSSSLLGGVAIGGLTFFVSLLIYLIVLFPLGMGLGAGFVTGMAVKQGKVRNPLVAGLFGGLTGLTM